LEDKAMRKMTTGNTFGGHTLHDRCYEEILYVIKTLFEVMTNCHNRVYYMTYVLKYPSHASCDLQDNNILISRFIEALRVHFKRRNHEPKYLWVRENSSTVQVHYHVMMLFDANCVNSAYGVLSKAEELWQRCMGGAGLVHRCKFGGYNDQNCGVEIRRNDPSFQQVYEACFQRATYLAKVYSKEDAPANVNRYGHSRIP
jgi:hypothetical protein